MTAITIDCDDCAMQHTAACADCVVTFLCDRTEGAAVVLQLAEARALRVLAEAGLPRPPYATVGSVRRSGGDRRVAADGWSGAGK